MAMSEDDLQRLLATQNQADVPAQAPVAPAVQPQSATEQAIQSLPPPPTPPQQSKLGAFFSNFNPTKPGGGIIPSLAKMGQTQYDTNKANYEAQKKDNLDKAAALDALHGENASAPVLKSYLKNMPGISPEIGQAIDGMDTTTLRSFLPRLSESFKLQNDLQDAVLKPKKEAETERHNRADEENARLHYENMLKEQQGKSQEKTDQLTQKRVDDSLQTLETTKRGASAGTFGMATKRSVLASDGLRIIGQIKSGVIKGDPAVQQELATVLASALQGGNQPGEHAIKAFVNRTSQGDAAKAAVYLSSAPQSAISKAFISQWEKQISGQDKYYKDLRDNTIKAEWERLKPSLEKNDVEKGRFLRSVNAQYPEFDLKKLGVKGMDFGIGPIVPGSKAPKTPADLDKMSDQELESYVRGK